MSFLEDNIRVVKFFDGESLQDDATIKMLRKSKMILLIKSYFYKVKSFYFII